MSIARQPHAYQEAVQCLFNWPKSYVAKVTPLTFQLLATRSRRYRAFSSAAQQEDSTTSSLEKRVERPHHRVGATSFFRQGQTLNFERKPSSLEQNVRQLMRRTPQSVVIVTSANKDWGEPELAERFRGATLSSFTVVTLEAKYPIISFNLKQSSSVFEAIRSSGRFYIHFPSATPEAVRLASDFSTGKGLCDVQLFGDGPMFDSRKEAGKWVLQQYPLVGNRRESPIYGSIMCTWLKQYTQDLGDRVVIYGSVRTTFHPEEMDPKISGLGYLAGEYLDMEGAAPPGANQENETHALSRRMPFGMRFQWIPEVTPKDQPNDKREGEAEKSEVKLHEEEEKQLERVNSLPEKPKKHRSKKENEKSRDKSMIPPNGTQNRKSKSAASPKSHVSRFIPPKTTLPESQESDWGALSEQPFLDELASKIRGPAESALHNNTNSLQRSETVTEPPQTPHRSSSRPSPSFEPIQQVVRYFKFRGPNKGQSLGTRVQNKIKSYISLKSQDAAKLSEILAKTHKTEEPFFTSEVGQRQSLSLSQALKLESTLAHADGPARSVEGSNVADSRPPLHSRDLHSNNAEKLRPSEEGLADPELKAFLDQLAEVAKKKTTDNLRMEDAKLEVAGERN